MKRTSLLLMLSLPLLVMAQSIMPNGGINFEQGLTWDQVKAKAKAANKFIFVDYYATWCGPCKIMDRDVYSNDTVGRYINERFISVKVQMDTTKNDGKDVRDWYQDAALMRRKYKITAFPTFLFFGSDGNALNKNIGEMKTQEFIKMAAIIDSPAIQYYTQLDKWREGSIQYSVMPWLANAAKKWGDKDTALRVAHDYMHGYLDKLNEQDFLTKEHLNFMGSYIQIIEPKDRIFGLCYHHADQVNAIVKSKSFANRVVDLVIFYKELDPFLKKAIASGKDPDWDKEMKQIEKEYGAEYAERVIINNRPSFYKNIKDWPHYTRYLVEKSEKYDLKAIRTDTVNMWASYAINNLAWEVFKYSHNNDELKKAAEWSDLSRKVDVPDLIPNDLDTKANILYKMGQKEAAMKLEEDAITMNEDIETKKGEKPNSVYRKTLKKMRKGEPTWN